MDSLAHGFQFGNGIFAKLKTRFLRNYLDESGACAWAENYRYPGCLARDQGITDHALAMKDVRKNCGGTLDKTAMMRTCYAQENLLEMWHQIKKRFSRFYDVKEQNKLRLIVVKAWMNAERSLPGYQEGAQKNDCFGRKNYWQSPEGKAFLDKVDYNIGHVEKNNGGLRLYDPTEPWKDPRKEVQEEEA